MVYKRIIVFYHEMTQLMLYCSVQDSLYIWLCRFSSPPPVPDNPSLLSHVPVTVQVLDVNDNPPEVAADEEVIVCESSRPGQVSLRINVPLASHLRRNVMKAVHAPGLGSHLLRDPHWAVVSLRLGWFLRLRGHRWKLFKQRSLEMSIVAAKHDSSKSKLIPICSLVFDSLQLRSFFSRWRAISMEMAERVGWQKNDVVETGKEQQSPFLMDEEKYELKPLLIFNQWLPQPRGFRALIQKHAYIHFISGLFNRKLFYRSWIQWSFSLLRCLKNHVELDWCIF